MRAGRKFRARLLSASTTGKLSKNTFMVNSLEVQCICFCIKKRHLSDTHLTDKKIITICIDKHRIYAIDTYSLAFRYW